nr:PREDICTED: epidermal growth factor-like protein 8 [Latimeria chalumnae]|eukprot:XP_014347019.1 PREDICTED: epidermal growth factor-like protein 8 [Latimeria chalumnae]
MTQKPGSSKSTGRTPFPTPLAASERRRDFGGKGGPAPNMFGLVSAALWFVVGASLGISCQLLRSGRDTGYVAPIGTVYILPYMTLCRGHRTYSTYRTTYRVSVRQVRREVLQNNYICCPGWRKGHLGGSTCNIALCPKPCQNSGACSKPYTCDCRPGWGGRYCQIDLNECQAQVQLCGQHCVNTAGSYRCECRQGYALAADRKSCVKLEVSPVGTGVATAGDAYLSIHVCVRMCTVCNELSSFSAVDVKGEATEQLSGELQRLHSKMETLEQQVQWTMATLQKFLPFKLEEVSTEQVLELWTRFEQLDRIESLSEQILFLEEKLGSCSCFDDS